MKILIIGAGMYVSGKNERGNGTILSSLAEISKKTNIEEVLIVATNPQNEDKISKISKKINKRLNTKLKVNYKSISGNISEIIHDLLSEIKFDCAILAVPDNLHNAYIKELLKEKINILVAKPFVTKLTEAKELTKLQEENNVYAALEFHKRFDESNLYVKKVLSQKQLGKLSYITVDYSQRISIPTKTFIAWSDKTNIFQYLGVHYVDLIYFLTDYIPFKLMAYGTKGILTSCNINTYDSVHSNIIWRHKDDPNKEFISIINTNWIDSNKSTAMSDQKFKIIGEKGRIEADQKCRGLKIINDDNGVRDINPYFSEYLYDMDGNANFTGYGFDSIRQFIDDIDELKKGNISLKYLSSNRPSFKSSIISVAITETVNKSLENKSKWIEINI